jgi:hypothetical protein
LFLASKRYTILAGGHMLRSVFCRRLRSGRCMAQILLSSTCKASVGERERDRQIRGSGLQEYLQKNNAH